MKASKEINRNLDIVYMIKKMRDLEKLKALLFDWDELELFEEIGLDAINKKKS